MWIFLATGMDGLDISETTYYTYIQKTNRMSRFANELWKTVNHSLKDSLSKCFWYRIITFSRLFVKKCFWDLNFKTKYGFSEKRFYVWNGIFRKQYYTYTLTFKWYLRNMFLFYVDATYLTSFKFFGVLLQNTSHFLSHVEWKTLCWQLWKLSKNFMNAGFGMYMMSRMVTRYKVFVYKIRFETF